METGGEPYLRSPEGDMPIFVRHSMDVYALFGGLCLLAVGLVLTAIWKVVRCASHLTKKGVRHRREHPDPNSAANRSGMTTKHKFS